jgi:Pentapeptide repeats (8 copies)
VGATLIGANLCSANLQNAALGDADLHGAHYDASTRRPTGFAPRAHGAIWIPTREGC